MSASGGGTRFVIDSPALVIDEEQEVAERA